MSIGEKSAEVIVAKKSRNGDGAKYRRNFNTFNKRKKKSEHKREATRNIEALQQRQLPRGRTGRSRWKPATGTNVGRE